MVREKPVVNNRQKGPKDSEIPVREWLDQIGATDIRYFGDRNETPDFEITYFGERVAVEVARLPLAVGWKKNVEIAFERELKSLIEEIADDPGNPRWHSRCEYDSRDRCPLPSEAEAWKERARKALLTRGSRGGVQLLPLGQFVGRGIVLELLPAKNRGSFSGVSPDQGYMIESTLDNRLDYWIDRKSKIVREKKPDNDHRHWWLVFDDEIVMAPAGILRENREKIELGVRDNADIGLWSKVVLVSSFQLERAPPECPKWFWPLWENPRCAALPDSPF